MSEKINWTLNVQVVGGPMLSSSDTMIVDAYDKIQVSADVGATDKKVEVQPGGSGQVQFLLITSDKYGEKLTYKVNDSASTKIIKLDGPQLLIGKGAVGLLDPAPSSLFFTNSLDVGASIEILVGRDATP
jgi:hypothetical protein